MICNRSTSRWTKWLAVGLSAALLFTGTACGEDDD